MTEPKPNSGLKLIFRLLPPLGGLCLGLAIVRGIYHAGFEALDYGLLLLGILLFLTLFIKAELANLKFYLHVVVYSLLVAGICVVGYLFARQYTKKVDLTEQKLYSLSPASKQYLERLDKEVKITIFADKPEAFQEIVDLYKDETEKVVWEFFNPVTERLKALQFGDNVQNGEMFVVYGENKKRMSTNELVGGNYENLITNAIVEVTREQRPKLYFLSGHGEIPYERGEPTADGKAQPSVQALREFMNERGMETAGLDLSRVGFVPEDATLVVIAGPEVDLLSAETAGLRDYLKSGGKLLVLLDPPGTTHNATFENLKKLVAEYGVELEETVVVDIYSELLLKDPLRPLVTSYDTEHPITQSLASRAKKFQIETSRPVTEGPVKPAQMKVTPLILSSEQSFAVPLETLMNTEKLKLPEKEAIHAQPLGLAVGKISPPQMPGMPPLKDDKGETRLVVYGSSILVQDGMLSNNQTAVELMLNTFNWLTEQEDMIAVPPKQVEGMPIVLDAAQARVIFVFSVLLIPAVLFFGGVSYSVIRRRR